ncbi:hypothetical protein Val02_93130 [Virgisporangium aliadipatigenens]|uniref:Uncharacterized protein n=1 Tax=Virgisporangium aliadipatigenens TaxID=741659 RepID=A0A8J3YXC9_9ACTN|nr:hypothetical protein [Virgisporangium aliadipatigenens]GIJ52427.1 hypothetical protein Val02_93130 [Virgisporangium aliadipatigenens]
MARIHWLAPAAFLLLGAAAPTTVPLHDAHRGAVAGTFGDRSCAQIPGGASPGTDGWVFVLPRNDADFVSLTLAFRTGAGTTATVRVPDASDPYPDGITTNGTSKAWVQVPAGWLLLDGSAEVSGPTKAPFFNLTHTCPGSPEASPRPPASPTPPGKPSPSPSASTPASPTPGASSSPGASPEASPATSASPTPVGGASGGGGRLPVTGISLVGILVTGGSGLLAGAILLIAQGVRRRRNTAFTAE